MWETWVRSLGREDPRKIPGEGNGNPLQYSCLGNPMDGGAWWATYSPWVAKSDMTERLHFTLLYEIINRYCLPVVICHESREN